MSNNQINSQIISFNPTFTFATAGDLSVSYSIQSGSYVPIGNTILIDILLTCTPTFTTSAGNMRIANLPAIASSANYIKLVNGSSGITWPASTKNVFGTTSSSNTFMTVQGLRSSNNVINFTTTNVISGVAITLNFSGIYFQS